MTLPRTQQVILVISGFVAIGIGGAILVAPAAFYAGYGIAWTVDPNLASEQQGVGGLLLGSGLLIAAGAFVAPLNLTATLLAAVLYLGYAGGRAVSMVLHGVPSTAIVLAGVVELGLGLASLLALGRYRRPVVPAQR